MFVDNSPKKTIDSYLPNDQIENANNKKDEYRLSRHFSTFPSDKVMPNWQLRLKQVVALSLGVIPFALSLLGTTLFRPLASVAATLDEKAANASGIKRTVLKVSKFATALLAIPFAGMMIGSAKLFGYAQKAAWGFYVEKPTGDGLNTRLAQYGVSAQAFKDLKAIAIALFNPQNLSQDQWTLRQWSQIKI